MENQLFSISGWILILDSDPCIANILTRRCKDFAKAFSASESPHRSTKGLISSQDNFLVRTASVAFHFQGSYQQCHSFRQALLSFCSVYHVTLDRGTDILLIKDSVQ
jgi:hypothetical protein